MLPEAVAAWLNAGSFGKITAVQPVGGGCINNGMRLQTAGGESFFLKTNTSTPKDMFACEAEGLAALSIENGPHVPQVFLSGPDFLLMEDLAPAAHCVGYWQQFGRQMAALHNCQSDRFGFKHDNYIGSTPQPNPWMDEGFEFFAEHRLLFQARLALNRGLLNHRLVDQVQRLCERLPELIPLQPASLLHGDLWSGNAISDSAGEPAIIDPAVYFGWAEAELAMTVLFGAFPNTFYESYQEVRPLEKGYRQRFDLYNLYHLLNHLNLFGSGYLGSVVSILNLYK